MKIAVATNRKEVSPHFGHCLSFTVAEIEDGKVLKKEEVPNPGHQPGFLPKFLAEIGINCIIAGGMGQSAQMLFAQSGIKVVTGAYGLVDDVIKGYVEGNLSLGENICDH
ncbi:NifB/NifX family molybdenum-iron cluster-binding protein [Candidatus Oleimmundimicrobium sp.]|uniref:NifB/NifX family molybdenum-iron cluster-binding protein n=1 Tax=Candidatus Oleimmundimicrobium sp. TaxID=3060597 RepID=UPI00271E6CC5|nr:NifB/NifX family molybdenum-iron cluster-binding protein [Candidatus Oleimmundimicrobium sp.]MDO8886613.1 NifB/NifX family molybdenum-iron cluster-binding protein [Candidatus Oleimmundimicrobium sp.]